MSLAYNISHKIIFRFFICIICSAIIGIINIRITNCTIQTSSDLDDYPLPIGYGQTISQPYIVALVTQSITPEKVDRVLEIGTGSGYQGWVEHSPFDTIIVTCSPSHIPKPLEEQLAESGKMIIPVGKREEQELILLKKKHGKFVRKRTIPVRFVPMVRENGKSY